MVLFFYVDGGILNNYNILSFCGLFCGSTFFLAGGVRFQYTKFGTTLFEVGGGRFYYYSLQPCVCNVSHSRL